MQAKANSNTAESFKQYDITLRREKKTNHGGDEGVSEISDYFLEVCQCESQSII